ncbi:DUF4838 domain-containing protein [candidate division GN15 bacterium]|uniref:DUF4838 domain-containing protein n=1 Tax=candidate division GN15 bacterium TaxID=2072418 RepID=A0A855X6T3_9BACT|nr:MAG: DUF4838 domain-containing protein [candidate division GN15 bacterium]
MIRPILLALLTYIAWETAAAAPDSLRLSENGRSEFTVYLPNSLSGQALANVDTLREYFRAVTGAELPIAVNPKKGGRKIVVEIGASHSSRVVVPELGSDGFMIWGDNGNLYLTANTEYGFQNAVYTFLESYLGCRLYSPSVRVVPARATIVLPAMSDRQVPAITFRMQNIHDSTYTNWHKLNTNDDFGLFVHTFQTLVSAEKYFESHPEYFSLINGNRMPTGQLCLSNPDVFRIVVEELRTRMKANPRATFWSVSQNDTYVPCECDACRAIDSVEGSPSGSLLTFVNRVADEFPDMTISTLAYQYSRTAPKHIKPRPNVNIMLCSIECNRSKPLAQDSSSASFVEDVRDWSRLTHNIFLWDYVINFRNLVSPFPNLRVLQPNIRFFAASGITSVFEQGLAGFGGEFAELRIYLLAKLLWNPDINVDSVENDFLQGFYGNAAPFIRQYIDTMHAVMQMSGEGLDIYGYPTRSASGYLSSAMLDIYNRIFDEAEAAVAMDEEVLGRVRTARLPVQFAILEQAKVAASGEGGCFVRNSAGGLIIRPEIDTLLSTFVRRCKEAAIPRLWEHGTTPDEYFASTRSFLDSGTKKHLALGKLAVLARPASPKYLNGDLSALTDGLKGWNDYHMHWLGFEGEDLDATIDLGSVQKVSGIGADFLQDINSWIFMPLSVRYSVSENGRSFRQIGDVADTIPADRNGSMIAPFNLSFAPIRARYVRVQATSVKTCPTWHKGSGGLAWIFVDEITIH